MCDQRTLLQHVMDDRKIVHFLVLQRHDPSPGPGDVGQSFDVVLTVAIDQEHGDGADLLEGEVGEHELSPVRQLHQHAVERFDAQLHQADRQPVGLFACLAVG